jgi:hypothetical protein
VAVPAGVVVLPRRLAQSADEAQFVQRGGTQRVDQSADVGDGGLRLPFQARQERGGGGRILVR